MKPIEYLAELQRQLNGTRCAWEGQHISVLDCSVDPLSAKDDGLPTPMQNPLTYAILKEAMFDVETVAPAVLGSAQAVRMPLCGSVDTGVFWAASLVVGEQRGVDDTLLLFSSGIFDAAHLLSKILAQNYKLIESEGGSLQYEVIPDALHSDAVNARFVDFACAHLIYGSPSAADQYFLPPDYDSITSAFCSAYETFIVAHEYAHVALGHVFAPQSVHAEAGEVKLDLLLHNWQDEFEADELAVRLTCAAMRLRGYDESLNLCGILLCLKTLWLAQRCDALKEDSQSLSNSPTHPAAELRMAMVRDFVLSQYDLECTDLVDSVLETLWQRNESLIALIYGQAGSLAQPQHCAPAHAQAFDPLPQEPYSAIYPPLSEENSLQRARFVLK